jgi:transposase
VRGSTVWAGLLGIEHATVERLELDPDGLTLVAHVRPSRTRRHRCGRCGKRCPRYDLGAGRRRWRTLDVGVGQAYLEADAPRVTCAEHGVVVAAVPWARHDSGHTLAFDDQVAWLAVQCSKTAVTQLMRVAWRTVGAIVERVCADIDAQHDRLAGLRRIGIDEISYKRHHFYLTVVVDHDSRRLVWAAPGRDAATLDGFFDLLGEQRCAQITHVSRDLAAWIGKVVERRCPAAVQCADPFHVVAWATDALDQVRRESWNRARRQPGGMHRVSHRRVIAVGTGKALKHARYALWKNPEDLTTNQAVKLAWIAKTDRRLYRAYLLKEGLRLVFQLRGEEAKHALDQWLKWARRCQIPVFVKLASRVQAVREAIEATLDHGLSNGLIESTNTKIRLLTRIAFGFNSPQALIALAMLSLGGHRPALPGRATHG